MREGDMLVLDPMLSHSGSTFREGLPSRGAAKSFPCAPVYFISDSPYKQTGRYENDATARC